MITAIILITIISAIFVVLNKSLPFKICPICAGVSGSWLILTAGIVFGHWSGDYKLPIAMLMGGTVVGIAFQGETKFDWARRDIYTWKKNPWSKFLSSNSSVFLWFWKAPVVILGMPIAYWLFKNMGSTTLVVEVILLALIIYAFFIKSSRSDKHADGGRVAELEKKMKNCC